MWSREGNLSLGERLKMPKLKIRVKYRGRWYYASSVFIDRDGKISIEYCHDLFGCVDSEHIEGVEIQNA